MRKKFPTKKGIIFVDDDSNVIVERPASIQRPHKWRDIIIGVLVSITLCIMVLGGWRLYNYYYNIGVPISVTPEENIQKLTAPHKGGKPTITQSSDSILVSDGVLPVKFHLHGKVERRALARTSDDHLYYIETRHPETLWDFADALREYGFADAIYITGGKCHSFYRTPDGKPHNIGDDAQHPHKKYQKIVPWIIFKAR